MDKEIKNKKPHDYFMADQIVSFLFWLFSVALRKYLSFQIQDV